LSDFEELDYRRTRLGELSLRRRRVLSLGGTEIYEVKPGDEFLMSSLFSQGEIALAGTTGEGFDPVAPGRRFHAVLLGVDHSPRGLLHPGRAAFSSPAGLRRLSDRTRLDYLNGVPTDEGRKKRDD